MTDRPTAPGRQLAPTSAMVAVALAAAAAVIATADSGLALSIATAGVAAITLGLPTRSHFWCAFGTVALVAGVVLAVLAGQPGWQSITGITLAYLAWDRAEHAISIGAQVGLAGVTHRAELRQAATSGLVGIVAIIVPLAAIHIDLSLSIVPLAILLAAAVLLLSANRI